MAIVTRNQRRVALSSLALVLLYLAVSACAQREEQVIRGGSVGAFYSISLADLSGASVAFQSYQGKILVIDFFASWCGPCKDTAPAIQAIHREFGSRQDIAVMGVSLDVESARDAVKIFVKRHGVTFPVFLDNGKIREVTGVYMVPTTLIIDKNGAVHARLPGAQKNLKERIAREIDQLSK
ncbi:MAG TPA: TlpA disulfide reductase family protein [Dissulfurispiraceae bacterium]|nr:TlpA disulfide reductase family protein [Dissulfurispiraceae bacterium]